MNQDINDILQIVAINNLAQPVRVVQRARRRQRIRLDPYQLPDREFKQRYRFSKPGVRRLVAILLPFLEGVARNDRGKPFSPEQIVCSGLDILGGGHFQRVGGVCMSSTKSTAHMKIYRYIQQYIR